VRLLAVAAASAGVCAAFVGDVGSAKSQTNANCPHGNGIHAEACSSNPKPDSVPSGMGGAPMGTARCASALVEALASLYSYDAPVCHSANNKTQRRS
jgi:hypothetical protein